MKEKKREKNFHKGKNTAQKPISMGSAILTGLLISTVIVLLLDYLLPTPWNIHSAACWIKVLAALIIYASINGIMLAFVTATDEKTKDKKEEIG